MTGRVQKAILRYLTSPTFKTDVPVAKAAGIHLICVRTGMSVSKIRPALNSLVKRNLIEVIPPVPDVPLSMAKYRVIGRNP